MDGFTGFGASSSSGEHPPGADVLPQDGGRAQLGLFERNLTSVGGGENLHGVGGNGAPNNLQSGISSVNENNGAQIVSQGEMSQGGSNTGTPSNAQGGVVMRMPGGEAVREGAPGENSHRGAPRMGQMVLAVKMEYFQPEKIKWRRWLMRLEETFQMYGIQDEGEKRALLTHYMGMEAYDKLCDRVSPKVPRELTCKEIIDEMTECYDPTPLEIVEIYKFQERKQMDGESCSDFLAALRQMSTNCKFGCRECNYLMKALRNQFVVGLRNKMIQKRLLEKRELTLEMAYDIAKAMETSEEGEVTLHKPNPSINKVAESITEDVGAVGKFTNTRKCFKCGSPSHMANRCRLKEVMCFSCNKQGHISKFCLEKKEGKKAQGRENMNKIEEILYVEGNFSQKICIPVTVGGKSVIYEVDSGSPISIIGIRDKDKFFPNEVIHPTKRKFAGYDGNLIEIVGFLRITIEVEGRALQGQNLYVAMGSEKTPILGREWIKKLTWLDWNQVLEVHKVSEEFKTLEYIRDLKTEFKEVFEESLGKIKGFQAELRLEENARPVFIKHRQVPFAMRDLVETEIKILVKEGVLEKVNQSKWGTPIVMIPKANGRGRMCGDFSETVNPNLVIDRYPLPTVEELLEGMAGGKKFSKIDLTQAYLQMEVREEDRDMLTLSTHKGLYRPTRMIYGVASAGAIWQRFVEQLFQDIPGVKVFMDDIRVTGKNDEEHLMRLKEVLKRLRDRNMRVNFDKCEFFADQIEYCGYVIDKEGIHKDPKKVEALEEMPRPSNKDEVRAYAGFVNYYGRFFPHLSTMLYPINNLVKENVQFVWDEECERAFNDIKAEMGSDRVLAHFDPKETLVLWVDASPVGVGACLGHRYADGSERPLFFASQTLTNTQQDYAQHDREAYGIIFGIKKFYTYIYGREFILVTDNKPLAQIFNPSKGIPYYSALRMQHYAMFLKGFSFRVEHRSSKLHGNADGLSRLPIKRTSPYETDDPEIVQIGLISVLPVTLQDIREETEREEEVKVLIAGLRSGKYVKKESRFGIPLEEFSLKQNCLVRGIRTYIPKKLRESVLNELHEGHTGTTKMKILSRSYCWWPNIEKDIERIVADCTSCQEHRANPKKVPIHVWEEAKDPFERVHIDYAGPICGKYLLIVVDAYSKWPAVAIVSNMTTETTIDELREIFATHGVPVQLISDQGRQFMSLAFQAWCKSNGITHRTGAPYHPATNGQAERYVRTIKEKLMALQGKVSKKDLHQKMCTILMNYRRTPHSATGESPSQRLFKRQIRTRLDLIVPRDCDIDREDKVPDDVRSLYVGDRVAARDYRAGYAEWSFGTVKEKFGLLHYNLLMDSGLVWKRHIDQIRKVGKKAGLELRHNGNAHWNDDIEGGSVSGSNSTDLKESEILSQDCEVTSNEIEFDTLEATLNRENETDDVRIELDENLNLELSEGELSDGLDSFQDALEHQVAYDTDSEPLDTEPLPAPVVFEGRPRRNIKPPDRLNL